MFPGSSQAANEEARRLREREEEEMTGYGPKDLAEGWEFKILTSYNAAFRNPEKLRAVLDEEKRGGWVLVEKFDNRRLRLKRPAGMKVVEGDLADGYDPYRTELGASPAVMVALVVGILLAVFIGLVFMLRLSVR